MQKNSNDWVSPLRIIVVGGGIGGLSAAIALRRRDHEVVVLERAPRLDPLGAGITLFANAMAALGRLEVAEAVASAGAPARHSAILTSDGLELTTLPAELLAGAVAVHRGELQRVLLEAFGPIRLGVEIVSIDQTVDGVRARAADGTVEEGDLLIGADGIRSVVRDAVAPADPRYAGYTVWRGVSPIAVAPGQLTEPWGAGARFGLVDIGSRTYWFATANVEEGLVDSPSERKAELMRRFARWQAPIATAIETTPDSAILHNDMYFLDPLRHWSDGRIVLLGDAAHATTPGVGQGVAQAIEDAVVLADQLSHQRKLSEALAAYETVRRPRAELALKLSRRADRAGQLTSPLGQQLRNYLVRQAPARVQLRQLGPLVHLSRVGGPGKRDTAIESEVSKRQVPISGARRHRRDQLVGWSA